MSYEHIGNNIYRNEETGETKRKQEVLTSLNEKVKVFEVNNQKNVKHTKFRVGREQKRIYKELNLNESGFLFKLMQYMAWETNILVSDGSISEKNKPLKWYEIDKLIGCSKPLRIKIVKSLYDKGIIGYTNVKGKRTGIVINPKYAITGYKPDPSLYQVFKYEEDVFDEEEE